MKFGKYVVLPAVVCSLGLAGCAGLSKEDRTLMDSAIKASQEAKAAAAKADAAAAAAKKAEDAAMSAQSAANKASDAAARAEAAATKMEKIFDKSLKKGK